jgi:hypothetical protein
MCLCIHSGNNIVLCNTSPEIVGKLRCPAMTDILERIELSIEYSARCFGRVFFMLNNFTKLLRFYFHYKKLINTFNK